MAEQLKPCPFCGSKAYVRVVPYAQNKCNYAVHCEKCGVGFMLLPRKRDAIAVWNKRV